MKVSGSLKVNFVEMDQRQVSMYQALMHHWAKEYLGERAMLRKQKSCSEDDTSQSNSNKKERKEIQEGLQKKSPKKTHDNL